MAKHFVALSTNEVRYFNAVSMIFDHGLLDTSVIFNVCAAAEENLYVSALEV